MENQQPKEQAQEQAQDAHQGQGLGSPFADRLASLGGPVHPLVVDLPGGGAMQFGGLTARDYYAAHAPSEIPFWFDLADPMPELDVPATPTRWEALKDSPGWEEAHDEVKEAAHRYLIDLMDEVEPGDGPAGEMAAFAHDLILAANRAQNEVLERNAVIQKQNLARRYFAWRRFYAEQMVGLMAK